MGKKFGVNVKGFDGRLAVQQGAGAVLVVQSTMALVQMGQKIGKINIGLLGRRHRGDSHVHVVFLNNGEDVDKVVPCVRKLDIKLFKNILSVEHYVVILRFGKAPHAAGVGKWNNHARV